MNSRHPSCSRWLVMLWITSQIPWILYFMTVKEQGQHQCSNKYNSETDISSSECNHLRMTGIIPQQDDPLLAKYVRENFLIPPNYSMPYNLGKVVGAIDTFAQYGQVAAINELFENTTKGFFVDCGAHNGEYMSNTIWLEKARGWTVLLIEVEPKSFKILQSKNRKAWLANVCLSPTIYPGKQTFFFTQNEDSSGSGLTNITYNGDKVKTHAFCLPLYSILLALDQFVVDVFSLDIEGAELEILKTIPFDKVFIKTLIIEHAWIRAKDNVKGVNQLRKFMHKNGYKFYRNIMNYDAILVHKSLLPTNFKEDDFGTHGDQNHNFIIHAYEMKGEQKGWQMTDTDCCSLLSPAMVFQDQICSVSIMD